MSAMLDALRRAIDQFPGARPAITLLMSVRRGVDKSDEVWRKELTGSQGHKLGAETALAMAQLCIEAGTPHCYDYPAHVAEECGGKFVLVHSADDAGVDPVQRVTGLTRETADVAGVVIMAMADKVVSDNELRDIEREIAEAEEVLRELLRAARANNLASKPRAAT